MEEQLASAQAGTTTLHDGPTLRAARVGVSTLEGKRLLQPTDLEVPVGQFLALIGPSGSGKTTLMRTLAGVTQPSEGDVTLGGKPLLEVAAEIGYLPFGDTVHDRLTVREALEYAAMLRLPTGTTRAQEDERVNSVLRELDMEAQADTRVSDLSGGERKRAACGIELIGSPAMLLLDEPATGLDPSLERRLMQMCRRLADEGRGVVVVTHATSSLRLADQVAVMARGGVLRFRGTPEEVLAHFGVDAFDAIYDVLADSDGIDEDKPHSSPVLRRPPRALRPRSEKALTRQASILGSRYAKLFMRDQRTLWVLMAQAPIIALAIGFVLPSNVLADDTRGPFYGIILCFLLLTGCIWLGVIASCREIVKERSIVAREMAAGVRLDAYLLAKALVLFPVVAVQSVILVAVAVILQPLHEQSSAYIQVLFLCVLVSWASVGLGLLVSALARSADQATSAVPLMLIPQLLFAGAIIPVSQMPAPVQGLSALTFSRWCLTGLGSAIGLDTRLTDDAASITGFDKSFFSFKPGTAAIVLLLFTLIGFVAAGIAMDRRSSS